jgi:DNA-binding transcriptional MocR family regulator
MVDVLLEHFKDKEGVIFNKPSGGMFIWLKIQADNITSEDLFKHLAAAGVITVPGGDFIVPSLNAAGQFVTERDPSIVRLTFSAAQPQQIRDAIKRLADGLKSIGVCL